MTSECWCRTSQISRALCRSFMILSACTLLAPFQIDPPLALSNLAIGSLDCTNYLNETKEGIVRGSLIFNHTVTSATKKYLDMKMCEQYY